MNGEQHREYAYQCYGVKSDINLGNPGYNYSSWHGDY